MRTKSEGGTTFTLCDKCFDEYYGGHIKEMDDAVGDSIEQEKHSFARSQAERFAEWCSINQWVWSTIEKFWWNKNEDNWKDDFERTRPSSSDLYSQFLLWQKQQQDKNETR